LRNPDKDVLFAAGQSGGAAGGGMAKVDQYVLGYRQAEQERLQRQAQELAAESERLFDQIGIAAGAQIVEIGCGPRGCLDLLANRAGPAGRVIGIERSRDAVAMARTFVKERGLSNVEVLQGDARATGLERAAFDVVTSRLVLVNIPQPDEVVAEAVALARPGGWVAFHEADWFSHVCDPPLGAWTDLIDLFIAYSRKNGIDPFIGRKVPALLRRAGIEDVRIYPIIHAYPTGHPRHEILLDFTENLSERLVAEKLASDGELQELKARLKQHLDDPGTLVVSHTFFQVWGRKP
jgi:ubiquinone/menaquinone biosynthesis C-methylase UbiE